MLNVVFLTENLEEILVVEVVASKDSCLCLSKSNFSATYFYDNTKKVQ